MADRITYVGLDVHKQGIVVAVAEDGLRGEVREYGRIANAPAALDRLARKFSREGVKLRFCYEAGLCDNGIQRPLTARGTNASVTGVLHRDQLCRGRIYCPRRCRCGSRTTAKR